MAERQKDRTLFLFTLINTLFILIITCNAKYYVVYRISTFFIPGQLYIYSTYYLSHSSLTKNAR